MFNSTGWLAWPGYRDEKWTEKTTSREPSWGRRERVAPPIKSSDRRWRIFWLSWTWKPRLWWTKTKDNRRKAALFRFLYFSPVNRAFVSASIYLLFAFQEKWHLVELSRNGQKRKKPSNGRQFMRWWCLLMYGMINELWEFLRTLSPLKCLKSCLFGRF